MKIISNILRHLGLSVFVLSTAQAAQISDKERYLLSQTNTYDDAKDDEKTDEVSHYTVKPIGLQHLAYDKWSKNSKIVYSPSLSEKQDQENIVNSKDERKEIEKLPLKLLGNKEPFDITHYVVKLHSDYGYIEDKKVEGQGTATIIKIEKGIIYLLTCAHNVIKHEHNPFGDDNEYYAKNVSFLYKGVTYPCNHYYVHPKYIENKGKDVAVITSHRGYAINFAYSFFPEVVSVSVANYKGYVVGFPGQKEKKGTLWGMLGDLEVQKASVRYKNIDTSKGQSGSAIWAKINGIYKIIGVHTLGTVSYNYGPLLNNEIMNWEKVCWSQTKEIYYKHEKVFNRSSDMTKVIEDPIFDVEMIDVDKRAPFLMAANYGNIALLKFLKNKGINIHVKNKYGLNALHYAAGWAPNGKGIQWLIDTAHLSIESETNDQTTPFLMAAQQGNLDALKILKNKGANLKATNQYGNNAFHLAALYAPNGKGIEWLIDTAKIDIESQGQYQMTPFLMAASKGNLDALKILKNKGANLKATDKDGDNALHYAALYAPNGKGIEWLILTAKIDIESKGQYQMTPFLMAASKGNLDALKTLKNKGANLKATSNTGNNALHLAALAAPNGKGIEWLIFTAKIDIESKGNNQATPFLWAANNGNLDALNILKNKGANLNATDKDGNNALHWAALFAPNGKGIEWLILTAKIDIESQGYYQKTPFLCAAENGNLDALNILKNNGANLYATDKDGDNALHYAALAAPNGKGIEWLILTAKIDIESQGQYQNTPFLMAAQKGNLDALNILKNNGANLYATDKDGNNALHLAARYAPNGKGIEWLINTVKIDVESTNNNQKTPFLWAAKKGNLDALNILKNNGANLYATDKDGDNALHYAALTAPNGKGIEWLIDTAKIDIESKGEYQKTPFLLAAENGNLDALNILKNKGANLNATDQDGNNALHFAVVFAPNGKGIQWLIDTAKIDIESKGQYQKTPFFMAAQQGNLDALNILKNKGANLKAKSQSGSNALYFAKKFSNSQETIDWLQEVCGLSDE